MAKQSELFPENWVVAEDGAGIYRVMPASKTIFMERRFICASINSASMPAGLDAEVVAGGIANLLNAVRVAGVSGVAAAMRADRGFGPEGNVEE